MTFVFSKGFLVHNVLKGLDHSKFKPINSSFGGILENLHLNLVRVTEPEGNLNANSSNNNFKAN